MSRVVCLDFNGVLDTYTGWKGRGDEYPPREGVKEFLAALKEEGYHIVVVSAIPYGFVRDWAERYGLAHLVDEFTNRKPAAHVYVDDRAVRFDGDYEATLQAIREFRPYWEHADYAYPVAGTEERRLLQQALRTIVTAWPQHPVAKSIAEYLSKQ